MPAETVGADGVGAGSESGSDGDAVTAVDGAAMLGPKLAEEGSSKPPIKASKYSMDAEAGALNGGNAARSSLGDNFDPLGSAERCPQELPWVCDAELEHGRIGLAWSWLVLPTVAQIRGPESDHQDAHKARVSLEELGPLAQVHMGHSLIEMLSSSTSACSEGLTMRNAGACAAIELVLLLPAAAAAAAATDADADAAVAPAVAVAPAAAVATAAAALAAAADDDDAVASACRATAGAAPGSSGSSSRGGSSSSGSSSRSCSCSRQQQSATTRAAAAQLTEHQ